jgi:phosphoribosyl-AMP cyclohydrolase / phosphoribosyl-ATP pyrophosphohydrolase
LKEPRDSSRTCIILSKDGVVTGLTKINRKGINKSMENNTLWHLHEQTDRLIPFQENRKLLKITEKGEWVEVLLENLETRTGSVEKERFPEENSTPEMSSSGGPSFGFLNDLCGIIKKRKESMPEGSYTTHLFSSGNEKIRKKTGEEAIELLLASSRDELVYEAADLVFHLLVLLEDEGIGLEEIIGELQKRHAE